MSDYWYCLQATAGLLNRYLDFLSRQIKTRFSLPFPSLAAQEWRHAAKDYRLCLYSSNLWQREEKETRAVQTRPREERKTYCLVVKWIEIAGTYQWSLLLVPAYWRTYDPCHHWPPDSGFLVPGGYIPRLTDGKRLTVCTYWISYCFPAAPRSEFLWWAVKQLPKTWPLHQSSQGLVS